MRSESTRVRIPVSQTVNGRTPACQKARVPLLSRSGSVSVATGPSLRRAASGIGRCERSQLMSMVNVTRYPLVFPVYGCFSVCC